MSDVKNTQLRLDQSKASKKSTLEKLKSKKARTRTIEVVVDGETLEMTFRALSAHDLDALQAKHKPTMEQRGRGFAFNPNTFAPALVAACSVEPKMSEEDTEEIWNSEEWSSGELTQLFDACTSLCMEGMQVSFSKSD